MENKSFVELLENAFDAGRRHDRNELRELKEKAKAAGAGIMIKTTTPPSSDVYSFRELSRILDSLSVVDHMIDSQAQRWAVEQQAAAILGQLSDAARDLAVGKTMFYAFYDDEEPAERKGEPMRTITYTYDEEHPTNRDYLVAALADSIDDGGASYVSVAEYDIDCPYASYSDCLNEHEGNEYDTKEYKEGCIRCKLAWLDREYDTYPSDDGVWERRSDGPE